MKSTILFLFILTLSIQSQILQPTYNPEIIKYDSFINYPDINNYSEFRIDSIHAYVNENYNTHFFKYDEAGNIVLDSTGYYGNQWNNISKYIWRYDEENRIDTFRIEFWSNDGYWKKYNLVHYNYNEQGELSQILVKIWNGNSWENLYNDQYYYDANGLIASRFYQTWDDTSWQNNLQSFYFVSSTGLIDSIQIHSWDKNNNSWYYEGEDVFTYDSLGNRITETNYSSMMGELYPYSRKLFEYNNSMKILELEQRYSNSSWINQEKRTYLFDENNIMVHSESFEWDGLNEIWNSALGSFKFFAPNGLQIILSAFSLDTYYSPITIVNNHSEFPSTFILEQNYPNPFNPSTTIKYSIPAVDAYYASTTNVLLKVYDILGREVATLVNMEQKPGNYEVTFDASNLTSGVYFYKLLSGSFVESKKMILIK